MKNIDRMAFRNEFIILEDEMPFGDKMETWQKEDFTALDNGQFRHAYLERPRGHSKTGDIGSEAVVEMVLGRPGQRLFCAAADEDQAKLLFEDVAGKFQRHPALRDLVRVTQKEIAVKATGSRLRVLASDAPTAYGLRPDWIAIDELAEWRRRELWDSLWTATGKRPNCRMLVISTAGWDRTSICWEVREIAEREADWFFSPRGQSASWISKDWLAQQQRTLPAHVYARLHESRWVDGVGAWLSTEQVEAVFQEAPDGDGPRCIGLDIGVVRDRTAIALVKRVGGFTIVEHLLIFSPTRQNRVDLTLVEEEVQALALRYGCSVWCDPYQAVGLAQRLAHKGVQVQEYPFTGERRRAVFATLLDLISTGRLRSRPHDAFRRELLSLEVKEGASGWRVDHRSNAHDDAVIAVGLGLMGLPPETAGNLEVWTGVLRDTASLTSGGFERMTDSPHASPGSQSTLPSIVERGRGFDW